jgi:16S rRNA processing protein RimM
LSDPRRSSLDTVVVGRIGRPHGVRGEVTVEVRTDDPDSRFVPGAVLATDPADRGPLTVTGVHWHGTVLLLRLARPDGTPIADREAAESVRNTELLVDVADLPDLDDDSFYDHQLVGLAARTTDGSPIGDVTAVRHEAQDLLVVARPQGGEVLIPFVTAIVPTVDLAGGFLVVDPPEGLLELPDL